MSHTIRFRDSFVSGTINGIINGAIAWHTFGNQESVPISLNSISNTANTVWGEAISLTFGLGIILSLITAMILKRSLQKSTNPQLSSTLPPLFPTITVIALNTAASLFGWFVVLAILWTRFFGEVYVSPLFASMLVGVFAILITALVEVKTKKAILKQ
ncbi:permease [Photobacterium damselae]|uniref:permease n=1 Tax=Photobacterium damselae TaxID=38293 RepID=UPI00083BA026|nr:permease [Photobacterium damselae]KAB1506919.1 permease [Photobacterium damselae subsp. damselae]ODA26235.1 permease [Photobacterium damselae subsp. damselae]TGZ35942.1 hypothetical protein EQ875_00788 [Photobacterium damselae subsp. damselae]TLS69992.1 permease [Photobacterium damselae subsp. damselae]TLS76105.1 permease [Photobacterium damselae subsp. damselae]